MSEPSQPLKPYGSMTIFHHSKAGNMISSEMFYIDFLFIYLFICLFLVIVICQVVIC